MAAQHERAYSFQSRALPADALAVVDFSGQEALCRPYSFRLHLVSRDPRVHPDKPLSSAATLTLHQAALFSENQAYQSQFAQDAADLRIHGIVAEWEEGSCRHGLMHYRALLVPRLHLLSLECQNQVYLDRSVPEIIESELLQAGLRPGHDYEFLFETRKCRPGASADQYPSRDEYGYPRWEYLCQYNESSLDFIHRLMEREGIYYFFEQDVENEKLVITNNLIHHPRCRPGVLRYAPDENLEQGPNASSFLRRRQRVARSVFLQEYNYGKPEVAMVGRARVHESGQGELFFHGEHFLSPEEGDCLAGIRAEEALCWQEVFAGESTAAYLQPGRNLTLLGHYSQESGLDLPADYLAEGFDYSSHRLARSALAKTPGEPYPWEYLCVKVDHQGAQLGFALAGIDPELAANEQKLRYENRFTCLRADRQYRPPRLTPRPRIRGSISAWIDLDGLDDRGRYKVRLPFERGDQPAGASRPGTEGLFGRSRGAGKASHWVRRAETYVGRNFGTHLPLREGTEVILSFIGGDPDRPVITGVMETPLEPSQSDHVDTGRVKYATGTTTTFSTSRHAVGARAQAWPGQLAGKAAGGFAGYTVNAGQNPAASGAAASMPAALLSQTVEMLRRRPKESDAAQAPDGFAGFSATTSSASNPPFRSSTTGVPFEAPVLNAQTEHGPYFRQPVTPSTLTQTNAADHSGTTFDDKSGEQFIADEIKEFDKAAVRERFSAFRTYTESPEGVINVAVTNTGDYPKHANSSGAAFTFPFFDNQIRTVNGSPVRLPSDARTPIGTIDMRKRDRNAIPAAGGTGSACKAVIKETFGDTYSHQQGATYSWGNGPSFSFWSSYDERHIRAANVPGTNDRFTFSIEGTATCDNAQISKTFGPTSPDQGGVLSFTRGYSRDIEVGPQYSARILSASDKTEGSLARATVNWHGRGPGTNGDLSKSLVSITNVQGGKLYEHFTGDQTTVSEGVDYSLHVGNIKSVYVGQTCDMTFGTAIDISGTYPNVLGTGRWTITMAASLDMVWANAASLYVGASLNITLAFILEIKLGLKLLKAVKKASKGARMKNLFTACDRDLFAGGLVAQIDLGPKIRLKALWMKLRGGGKVDTAAADAKVGGVKAKVGIENS